MQDVNDVFFIATSSLLNLVLLATFRNNELRLLWENYLPHEETLLATIIR